MWIRSQCFLHSPRAHMTLDQRQNPPAAWSNLKRTSTSRRNQRLPVRREFSIAHCLRRSWEPWHSRRLPWYFSLETRPTIPWPLKTPSPGGRLFEQWSGQFNRGSIGFWITSERLGYRDMLWCVIPDHLLFAFVSIVVCTLHLPLSMYRYRW